jgi:hypothetical protein
VSEQSPRASQRSASLHSVSFSATTWARGQRIASPFNSYDYFGAIRLHLNIAGVHVAIVGRQPPPIGHFVAAIHPKTFFFETFLRPPISDASVVNSASSSLVHSFKSCVICDNAFFVTLMPALAR